jgi:hypothetical protein
MPEETALPLLVAVLLTSMFVALLVSAYVAAGIIAGFMAVAVTWWLWHRPEVEPG